MPNETSFGPGGLTFGADKSVPHERVLVVDPDGCAHGAKYRALPGCGPALRHRSRRSRVVAVVGTSIVILVTIVFAVWISSIGQSPPQRGYAAEAGLA